MLSHASATPPAPQNKQSYRFVSAEMEIPAFDIEQQLAPLSVVLAEANRQFFEATEALNKNLNVGGFPLVVVEHVRMPVKQEPQPRKPVPPNAPTAVNKPAHPAAPPGIKTGAQKDAPPVANGANCSKCAQHAAKTLEKQSQLDKVRDELLKLRTEHEEKQEKAAKHLQHLRGVTAKHQAATVELAQLREHSEGLQLQLDGAAKAHQHLVDELQVQRQQKVKQLELHDEENRKWESRMHDILVNHQCPELEKVRQQGADQLAQHAETLQLMTTRMKQMHAHFIAEQQKLVGDLQQLRIENVGLRELLQASRANGQQHGGPASRSGHDQHELEAMVQQLRDQNVTLRQQLSELRSSTGGGGADQQQNKRDVQISEAQLQHLRQLSIKHQEACAELRKMHDLQTEDGAKIAAQQQHLRSLSAKHQGTLTELQKLRTLNMRLQERLMKTSDGDDDSVC